MHLANSIFIWCNIVILNRYLNYIIYVLFIGLLLDRYRIQKKNKRQLILLNTKKQWLQKELQHRIKNNLQIITSLLNSQSEYIENEEIVTAIKNSQHRIYAISLAHQKLYEANNLSGIDISWYIKELVNYLKDSFAIDNKIKFELNIKSVPLDVEQAVPLGLILNEAITNAIKYAFPNRQGIVNISFREISKNEYKLVIADDGVGFKQGFNINESNTLGINLMTGLTEQLDGTFKITSKNGVTVTIEFLKK